MGIDCENPDGSRLGTGAQFSSSLERSRRSNGRVERNGKLVFSSSFDIAFERHLVYDFHAVLPSRSFHLQANQQPSLTERELFLKMRSFQNRRIV